MIVVPLGCGGWISNPLLGPPAVFAKACGLGLLMDAGEGVYAALRRCGLDVADVDCVLVTHRHGDHVLGLPTLALYAQRLGKTLRVVGPADLRVRELFEAAGVPHYLEALELELVDFALEPQLVIEERGVRVLAAPVDHVIPSLAYRVECSGVSIAYSGDTRPCPSLARLARGCKLLIHEASANPGQEELAHSHGHSTTGDAVRVAVEAGVEYLMPLHYYVEAPLIPPAGLKVLIPIPCTPVDVAKL